MYYQNAEKTIKTGGAILVYDIKQTNSKKKKRKQWSEIAHSELKHIYMYK